MRHHSLYPDDQPRRDRPGPHARTCCCPGTASAAPAERDPVVTSYLRYLRRRPDSVLAALRAIAEPDGATVVHCAAGKDRTGMIIALALTVARGEPAS